MQRREHARDNSGQVAAPGGVRPRQREAVPDRDEPLADDEVPIVGASASVQRLNIAGRVILEGSARYLRVMRPHASSVPDDELSGSVGVQIRILGVRRKQLFLGGIARFGPAGPSLATDKTFGLRGIWKLK